MDTPPPLRQSPASSSSTPVVPTGLSRVELAHSKLFVDVGDTFIFIFLAFEDHWTGLGPYSAPRPCKSPS